MNDLQQQPQWYDKTWLVILLCIVFFPVGIYALWKNESISKGWKIAITVIISMIVIGQLAKTESATNSSTSTDKPTVKTENNKEEVSTNWSYSEDEDKMTNEKRYFTTNTSTNEIEFEFPYNGGSNAVIIVRKMGNDKNSEVVIRVTKGQFMTSISGSESIRIKFDDNKLLTYSFNSASDGSSDVIFINNSTSFIKNLKASKKVLAELPFFTAGVQHFEFDVEGLKWDR